MTTQTATPPAQTAQARQRQRRRFNVSEYYAMAEAGILTEKDRVELLDGEIVLMAPIGNHHASRVARITRMLIQALDGRAILWAQNPVRLNDSSEPEPDIALLAWRDDDYESAHPGPNDVLLLIEVADSSLESDRNDKLPLYARAGIVEVWIVNLRDRQVETYSEPTGAGYGSARCYAPGASVAPLNFPDIPLEVSRLFPA